MAKKQNTTPPTDEAPIDQRDLIKAGQDIGVAPQGTNFSDADPMASGPAFVPNQNWENGQTLTGKFVETERVYNDKKPNWKKGSDGRRYRDLHHLEDMTTGDRFSIWSVGVLDNFFGQVPVGAPVAITYTGLGTEPLKEGQNPPHTFKFALGEGFALTRTKPKTNQAAAPIQQ